MTKQEIIEKLEAARNASTREESIELFLALPDRVRAEVTWEWAVARYGLETVKAACARYSREQKARGLRWMPMDEFLFMVPLQQYVDTGSLVRS